MSSANLCKSVHDITNYSTFICPFKFEKCENEGKNYKKFEYIEKEKSFFDKIKKIL